MSESILISTKRVLGLAEDYHHFDPDVVMHINAVLADLNQLGVGPLDGFYIGEDGTEEWGDFVDDVRYNNVKSYIYLRVRMLFDSATMTGPMIGYYQKEIDKLEWRLRVQADVYPFPIDPDADEDGVIVLDGGAP